MIIPPLVILALGMALVIGAILWLRLNAFVALLLGALTVSLLAPGEAAVRIPRVAEGFGRTAGSIGIVIALAAIIGQAMLRSRAADRIVIAFLSLFGERRAATALGATGFVLSIPVFFDTVFYLLVPLARSMHARTGRHYLRYLVAIAGGAAATHALVPPTPGPLAVASALSIDLGLMVVMGLVVAFPGAVVAMWFAARVDRRMPVTPAAGAGEASEVLPEVRESAETREAREARLPGLAAALTPIALPVLLIAANTLTISMLAVPDAHAVWGTIAPWTTILGNPNIALLLAALFALGLCATHARDSRAQLADLMENALGSAGLIILITAAGGAFGTMLQVAGVGPAMQALIPFGEGTAGFLLLFFAFGLSSLIKIAQGSSTVAMITTGGMLAAMLPDLALPFHPVYVATAVCSGSLVGTWMNDSGFWVFSRMGGVSETGTLASWTIVAALVGATAMFMTLVLSVALPLV